MNIAELKFIYHGSDDSLDKDIYVLCPKPLEHKESLDVISHFENLGFNANPIFIEQGIVKWNFKGVNDEVQNSIFHTYELHTQNHPKPIEQTVERNHGLKALRTIRGLLSQCSRTQYREAIKPTLKNTNLVKKIEAISQIDFTAINDFEKISKIEAGKFFAFQLGQTLALIEENVDLFTKKSVAQKYPEFKDLLYRKEDADFSVLNDFTKKFLDICSNNFKEQNGIAYYKNQFNSAEEKIDIKKEIVLEVVVNKKLKP